MKLYKKYICILYALLIIPPTYSQKMSIDKTIVSDFNLESYLGTWYEIARYDHSFERNLVGVTAQYSLHEKGKIIVMNKGYKNSFDGKLSDAKGKAKLANINKPAHLRVSFFLFFYSDYLVLELDENYEWAVVGSKSDKYLWILARKPYLSQNTYREILEKIALRGYDTKALIKVEQNMDNYIELPSL